MFEALVGAQSPTAVLYGLTAGAGLGRVPVADLLAAAHGILPVPHCLPAVRDILKSGVLPQLTATAWYPLVRSSVLAPGTVAELSHVSSERGHGAGLNTERDGEPTHPVSVDDAVLIACAQLCVGEQLTAAVELALTWWASTRCHAHRSARYVACQLVHMSSLRFSSDDISSTQFLI